MKEKILNLKKLHPNWGYKKLAAAAQCSTTLIRYYTKPGFKEGLKDRNHRLRNRPDLDVILKIKKDNFQCIGPGRRSRVTNRLNGRSRAKSLFSPKQLREKLISNPICYLTGRSIDLLDRKSYNLDHIIPVFLGGDNSLGNCGLTCKEANMAKNGLSVEDFIHLCREVVKVADS